MMMKIGSELQRSMKAFKAPATASQPIAILDMCMAPGGLLQAAIKRNPGSRAVAFTLPVSMGGHKVLMPKNPNVDVKLLDVTMLAADMGVVHDIPADHPDAANFVREQQLQPDQLFDIAICGGHVWRVQAKALAATDFCRNRREAEQM
jgi:hypothetical protein